MASQQRSQTKMRDFFKQGKTTYESTGRIEMWTKQVDTHNSKNENTCTALWNNTPSMFRHYEYIDRSIET